MKKILFVVTMFLTVASLWAAENKKTVLLLGDSIRMGYGPYVADMMKDRAKVVYPRDNCRFTFYTLRMIADWKKLVDDPKSVDIVHFNNGLWDIGQLDGRDCLTPVDVYASTLQRIVAELKYHFPNARIVFATTTPVNMEVYSKYHTKGNVEVERYNAAACEALKGLVFAINDLYGFVTKNDVGRYYADSAHYKKEGYRLLATEVVRVLDAFIR